MNLRDLQYIVAVAELRSFSSAANQCCVSQSTLSGQIKKVEAWLGVQLFERSNRHVIPTEAGLAIVHAARGALRQVDVIRSIADNALDPLTGQFRLGGIPTLASYLFPPIVSRLRVQLPGIHLSLVEKQQPETIEHLLQGKLDAAFLANPTPHSHLQSETVFEDVFYWSQPLVKTMHFQCKALAATHLWYAPSNEQSKKQWAHGNSTYSTYSLGYQVSVSSFAR